MLHIILIQHGMSIMILQNSAERCVAEQSSVECPLLLEVDIEIRIILYRCSDSEIWKMPVDVQMFAISLKIPGDEIFTINNPQDNIRQKVLPLLL
jgi:hypothetical protein